MDNLEAIAHQIRESFDEKTAVRDKVLGQARTLTRHCAHAIRALHREDTEKAQDELKAAKELADSLSSHKNSHPSLFFAGYTQDALKEYAEANIVAVLLDNGTLPSPEDLGLQNSTYLKGLAEVVGELRRRCLDILRNGHSDEVNRLMTYMDDIYDVLVTIDYPDAVTHGLRRQTDIVRGIVERTRGDITMSFRQERLEETLRKFDAQIQDPDSKE